MDVVTFFKWDSKASKTTLIFPLVAILLFVATFLIFIFPESQLSTTIDDYVQFKILSWVIVVVDAILIFLMLLFQPSKTPSAKKKAEENKSVVVSSSEDEEEEERVLHDGSPAKVSKEDAEEEKTVVVKTQEDEEEPLSEDLKEEMLQEPELEATPEEVDLPDIEEPKPAAMVKSIVSFPEAVGGGIFADTYINAGNGTTLKLRQEVVEEIYLIT